MCEESHLVKEFFSEVLLWQPDGNFHFIFTIYSLRSMIM